MKAIVYISLLLLTLLFTNCTVEQSSSAVIIDNSQLEQSRTMEEEVEVKPTVSFTIIYDNDKDELDAFLASYELQPNHTFDLDSDMHGIEVFPRSELMTPVEVGKMISMQENVLMVRINNIPSKDSTS
jgi:hypothetical protein